MEKQEEEEEEDDREEEQERKWRRGEEEKEEDGSDSTGDNVQLRINLEMNALKSSTKHQVFKLIYKSMDKRNHCEELFSFPAQFTGSLS